MDMTPFEIETSLAHEVDVEGHPLTGKSPVGTRTKARGEGGISPAVLDRIERVGIILLWGLLLWRVAHSLNGYAPLVLIGETMIVVFTMLRRPAQAISVRLGDWLLAVTATAAPLCIIPGQTLYPVLAQGAIMLMIVGNVIQIMAKLALARSFGIAPANRGIKVAGLYRFVRHPMYAGYLLVNIGVFMIFTSWVNGLVYAIGWTAQIRRLLAEEALLSHDPAYHAYLGQVRWRLLPGIF